MGLFATANIYSAVLFLTSTASSACPSLFSWISDAHDCSKFYRCVWGKGHGFSCPSGTLWSQELLTCDFKEHVKCGSSTSSEAKPEFHDHTSKKQKQKELLEFISDTEISSESVQKKRLKDLDEDVNQISDNDQSFWKREKKKKADTFEPVYNYKYTYHNFRDPKSFSEQLEAKSTKSIFENDHTPSLDLAEAKADHLSEENNADDNFDQITELFLENEGGTDDVKVSSPAKDENDFSSADRSALEQLLAEYIGEKNADKITASPKQNPPSSLENDHQSLSSTSFSTSPKPEKDLPRKDVGSKLLHSSRSDDYRSSDFANTEEDSFNALNGLEISLQKFPQEMAKLDPYKVKVKAVSDQWAFADLFRAGYGYRKIYQEEERRR